MVNVVLTALSLSMIQSTRLFGQRNFAYLVSAGSSSISLTTVTAFASSTLTTGKKTKIKKRRTSYLYSNSLLTGNVCRQEAGMISGSKVSGTSLAASESSASPGSAFDQTSQNTLRILVLHGSEGTAESFSERLAVWQDELATIGAPRTLEIKALNAPFAKGQGYAWWTMPPGVRSFTAKEYQGFDESRGMVNEALSKSTFDLIVGHSQGAILLSALLAVDESIAKEHKPRLGFILNGVAWPNPFTKQLESLKFSPSEDPPRILMVMGNQDRINPTEQAERVQQALERAGAQVSIIRHNGGHSLPSDSETVQKILKWTVQSDV